MKANAIPFLAILVLLALSSVLQARDSLLGAYANKFKGTWVKGKFKELQYQIHAPSRVSRQNSLPVVIYLHGSAECGDDNEKQIKVLGPRSFAKRAQKRPCILVVPQAPRGNSWAGTTGDVVLELIDDLLKEVAVADKKRVYLTGFSLGGMGTWHLLGMRPDLFAAAIPVAGFGKPDIAGKLRGVKVWIFHGDRDGAVPPKYAREMSEALRKAGAPVKYTELKNTNHNSPGKVYTQEEVHTWLFAQKRK